MYKCYLFIKIKFKLTERCHRKPMIYLLKQNAVSRIEGRVVSLSTRVNIEQMILVNREYVCYTGTY